MSWNGCSRQDLSHYPRLLDAGEFEAETLELVREALVVIHQPISVADGLLAATAIHRDLTLVTRNVSDFEPNQVPVLNPFTFEDDGEFGRILS